MKSKTAGCGSISTVIFSIVLLCVSSIIISKSLTQRKKLSMSLLVGQHLKKVHLIKKKINLIITEEKIVLTNCENLKRVCNETN